MGKKTFTKEPLLYISQPDLKKPRISMQYDYYTHGQQRRCDCIIEADQQSRRQKEQQDIKAFNHMTIKEKIVYLMRIPDEIASVKCEVITEERNYRGIINEFKEDVVSIVIGRNRKTARIELEEITNIKLLGL